MGTEFRDELRRSANHASHISEIINLIKASIRVSAKNGSWGCDKIYKLEASNFIHNGRTLTQFGVKEEKIPFTGKDLAVIEAMKNLGLDVSFISVNLNPNPEFGEECYKAAYYMNVSWK